MDNTYLIERIDLQLFADGGTDGGDTGAGGSTGVNGTDAAYQSKTGEKNNPLATVVYGKQSENANEEETPAAEEQKNAKEPAKDKATLFREMIEGEYKDEYSKLVSDTVQKRLKNAKDAESKLSVISPALDTLSRKYGVKDGDYAKLAELIDKDNSLIEDAALDAGMTVDAYREYEQAKRENEKNKARIAELERRAGADEVYNTWISQAESAKTKFPSLDLNAELKNDQFVSLLRAGIDVESAYTVVHKDDIIPQAMYVASEQAKKQVASSVAANKARPSENGTVGGVGNPNIKSDVSQLTRADRKEIARRVSMGAKIVF